MARVMEAFLPPPMPCEPAVVLDALIISILYPAVFSVLGRMQSEPAIFV